MDPQIHTWPRVVGPPRLGVLAPALGTGCCPHPTLRVARAACPAARLRPPTLCDLRGPPPRPAPAAAAPAPSGRSRAGTVVVARGTGAPTTVVALSSSRRRAGDGLRPATRHLPGNAGEGWSAEEGGGDVDLSGGASCPIPFVVDGGAGGAVPSTRTGGDTARPFPLGVGTPVRGWSPTWAGKHGRRKGIFPLWLGGRCLVPGCAIKPLPYPRLRRTVFPHRLHCRPSHRFPPDCSFSLVSDVDPGASVTVGTAAHARRRRW